MQRTHFCTWQRHDNFDAVVALRRHPDIEHALWVDALLEHVDDATEHAIGILLVRRHAYRVHQTHTALQILAVADARGGKSPCAEHTEDGQNSELQPEVLHRGLSLQSIYEHSVHPSMRRDPSTKVVSFGLVGLRAVIIR